MIDNKNIEKTVSTWKVFQTDYIDNSDGIPIFHITDYYKAKEQTELARETADWLREQGIYPKKETNK